MKVIIFGGTGFIGKYLINLLLEEDWEVYVVTRNQKKADQILGDRVQTIEGTIDKSEAVSALLTGRYSIINLAGENVGNKLWTRKQKHRILQSRVTITRWISEMINSSQDKPAVVIQASATGFYGSDMDLTFDESSLKGDGFLADVTEQWENALDLSEAKKIRIIYIRTGLVLGKNEGLIAKLKIPFKLFVGGHFGKGRHWLSWIHIFDEVQAIKYLLTNDQSQGIYNLTAPEPVRMNEFCRLFGKVLLRPSWLHIPSFVLKPLPGNMAEEVLLNSQKVRPAKLQSEGFTFRYKKLEDTLIELLSNNSDA
jgi:uncharacterized protein (TIGR01777 family)